MSLNVEKWSLLKHEFYRAWEDGSLSRDTLKTYAGEYFHHVSAFPRYLSRMHSNIESIETRKIVLENLVDEERGERHHQRLWIEFCEAMGWQETELRAGAPSEAIQNVMKTFFRLADKSASAGLGALYAYESQIPEIAEFKLTALKKFYVEESNHKALEFFEVHKIADKYHREALEKVFAGMSEAEQQEAQAAAEEAAQALWKFLDHMNALEMAA